MWSVHVRFGEIQTPRSRILFVVGQISLSPMCRTKLSHWIFDLLKCNNFVFCKLKSSLFSSLHFISDNKSFWSSIRDELASLRSSANRNGTHSQFSGRSFINAMKKSGPTTEPWGTPLETRHSSDWQFSILVCCTRFCKYEAISLSRESPRPRDCSFFSSIEWGTRSIVLE